MVFREILIDVLLPDSWHLKPAIGHLRFGFSHIAAFAQDASMSARKMDEESICLIDEHLGADKLTRPSLPETKSDYLEFTTKLWQ